MKKILSVAAAIALASAFFVACSDDPDDGRNSYIDTYKLDAVDITVKAYPGFNYISWGTPTAGADVQIVRDDGAEIATAAITGTNIGKDAEDNDTEGVTLVGKNAAIDTNVKDGVTYKYTAYVIAKGDNSEVSSGNQFNTTNTSNEYKTYYTVKGNSKSASAKAIHPDVYTSKGELTTALDLTKCSNAGSANYVISEKNLILQQDLTGHLYIAFPTKAYLNYSWIIGTGNTFDVFGYESNPNSDVDDFDVNGSVLVNQNFYKMDNTYSMKTGITSAGTYQAAVVVMDYAGEYAPSVVKSATYTIEALDTYTSTNVVGAGYIDAGKTIRIVWKPAVKSNNGSAFAYGNDNAVWGTENYKIYKKDQNFVYTEIAPLAVKKGKSTTNGLNIGTDTQAGETVYYVDWTVPEGENNVGYDFYVVLSDGDKVEDNTSAPKTVHVASYGKIAKVTAPTTVKAGFTFDEADKDDLTNDAGITLTVTQNATEPRVYVDSVKYLIVGKNTDTTTTKYTASNLLLDSQLASAAVTPSADYTSYSALVKNVDLGSKVVFLYTLKQEGKENYVGVVTTNNGLTGNSYSETFAKVGTGRGSLSVVFGTGDDRNKATVSIATGIDDDGELYRKDLYKYEAYYAKILNTDAVKEISDITTEWKSVTLDALKWDTTNTTYNAKGTIDLTSEITTKVFNNSLESADGTEKLDGYADTFVFKFVVTNTKAGSAEGAVTTTYSSAFPLYKPAN